MGMFDTINEKFNTAMDDPMFNMGLALMSQWKTPPGQFPSLAAAMQQMQQFQTQQQRKKLFDLEYQKEQRAADRQKGYESWVKEQYSPAVPETPYQADNAFNEDLGNLRNAGKPATFAGAPMDAGIAGMMQYVDPDTAFKIYLQNKKGFDSTSQIKNLKHLQSLPEGPEKDFFRNMLQKDDGTPSSIEEWNAYKDMTPDQQQAYREMKRSQPWLNAGGSFISPTPTGGVRGIVPKTLDPNELPAVKAAQTTAVEEAKTSVERAADEPKARLRLQSNDQKFSIIEHNANRAKTQIGRFSTGLPGQILSNLGGTDARDLKATLDTIKANIGFDELQQMRQESPTGGALGQVAVQEINYLQSVIASLDQAQTADELREKIDEVVEAKRASNERIRKAFEETYNKPLKTERQPSQQKASKSEITRQYNDAMKRAKGNPELQKKLTDLYKERMKQ